MSLLFTIVRAAHANGTHHKLALDALTHLERPDAESWRRLFLKHADTYMVGAKAPDDEFKDFKNHVLHVRDGYWGGAPERCRHWYGELVTALTEGAWEQAVRAAGVLSHYVTDPVHPFHTGQSDAENSLHRALEWSVSRSYDDLYRAGSARTGEGPIAAGTGSDWLAALVIAGAERANAHYETLIAHYDLNKGAVDPPAGLDRHVREVIGGLLVYAAGSFATVLDRAITESGATAPEVALTAETVLAALKIPAKWLTKKVTDHAARTEVQRMYDELMRTGRVEETLPEDDRAVRDLWHVEVEAPRLQRREALRRQRLAQLRALPAAPAHASAATSQATAAASLPVARPAQPAVRPATPLPPARDALSSRILKTRGRLDLGDDLERAPSIGPKLAERLAMGGIKTVAEFLEADAEATALMLADRRFDAGTIERWQHEARLVLALPGLTGTQAQLLAGAGYRTVEEIASADPVALSAALLAFAGTGDGQRILRSGDAPDLEIVTQLVERARGALAA